MMDALNRRYSLEIPQSKDSIVRALKEKIENAKKNTSWFSFENIQYSKMQIDDYRMIIKRSRTTFNPYGGNGVIVVHFNQTNIDQAKFNVEIRPFRIGLWVLLACLILLTAFVTWLMRATDALTLLIPAWIIFTGFGCLSVILFWWGARSYLKKILADIGVNDYSLTREN